jgi:hypothetical protein
MNTHRKNIECFFFRNILMYGLEQVLIERARKKIKQLNNLQISKQNWIKNFGYTRFDKRFIIFSPNKNRIKFKKNRFQWLIKIGFNLRKKQFNMRSTRKKLYFLNKETVESIIFPGLSLCGFFFQHYKFKKN